MDVAITPDRRQAVETVRLRPSNAVRVVDVEPGSAAAKAGVREGDRIVEHGGRTVRHLADLFDAVFESRAGGEIVLVVIRDGARVCLRVAGGKLGVRVRNDIIADR